MGRTKDEARSLSGTNLVDIRRFLASITAATARIVAVLKLVICPIAKGS